MSWSPGLSPTAFLDTNVPIYASGAASPHKGPCAEVLGLASAHPRNFVTSVEVLQELLHRFSAPRRWPVGRYVLARFVALMRGRTEPVYPEDLDVATELADLETRAGARDLVHAAVMRRMGVELIVSADRGFDQIPGVTRLDPLDVELWRDSLLAPDGDNGAAPQP